MLKHWESHKPRKPRRSRKHLKYKTTELPKKQITKEFFCDLCSYKAFVITKLKHHIIKGEHLKPLKNKVLECEKRVCSYQSVKLDNMKKHETSHGAKAIYFCDFCDYSIEGNKIAYLKNHSRKEHVKFRHKCEYCLFKAKSRGSITRHIEEIHNNIKFSCNLCNFHTKISEILKKHKLTEHEGVRYKCDVCKFKSRNNAYVAHHKKVVHEGLRYDCDQCDHKSTQVGALNQHKRRVHGQTIKIHEEFNVLGVLRQQCPDCSNDYSIETIKKHQMLKHGFI